FQEYDKEAKAWVFKPGLLQDVVKANALHPTVLTDPLGGTLTLESLPNLEPGFTVDNLARAQTWWRMQQLGWFFVTYANTNQAQWFKDGKWTFPETVLADAVRHHKADAHWLQDAWG